MSKRVVVVYRVKREGFGNGPVWWMALRKEDIEVVGMGSGQKLVVKKGVQPFWLPRPDGERCYLSRAKGVRVDGEARVELEEGTFLKVGATCAGGWRCAQVRSPILIVAEGTSWSAVDYDGTRGVRVIVENAREATLEDYYNMEVRQDEEVVLSQ